MKLAESRSDDFSKAVIARINFEYGARYHDGCYKSFLRPNTGGKVGRPQDQAVNSAMEEIFKFLETSDDCQFTLDELKNVCPDDTLDNRILKERLIDYNEAW